tara:strand:+ start:59 stop:682 length:624 start_codon:yes stop_codon:yes gene_type:complete
MKRLLLILILTISFQSWTKADDLRDFEIAGISVGDSLLDHFSKEKILEELNSSFTYIYKDNKFADMAIGNSDVYILNKKFDNYYDLGVVIKPNDKNFKIYKISGRIFCKDDFNICLSKKKEIVSELINFFGNKATPDTFDSAHGYDKTGNSKSYATVFNFKAHEDLVRIVATNWSQKLTEEKQWNDNLKIEIFLREFVTFMENEAYN